MTIDVKKMSDEELAALNFAMERFCDGMNEENYNPDFQAEANEIGGALSNEYTRRKLNWKQFQKR